MRTSTPSTVATRAEIWTAAVEHRRSLLGATELQGARRRRRSGSGRRIAARPRSEPGRWAGSRWAATCRAPARRRAGCGPSPRARRSPASGSGILPVRWPLEQPPDGHADQEVAGRARCRRGTSGPGRPTGSVLTRAGLPSSRRSLIVSDLVTIGQVARDARRPAAAASTGRAKRQRRGDGLGADRDGREHHGAQQVHVAARRGRVDAEHRGPAERGDRARRRPHRRPAPTVPTAAVRRPDGRSTKASTRADHQHDEQTDGEHGRNGVTDRTAWVRAWSRRSRRAAGARAGSVL